MDVKVCYDRVVLWQEPGGTHYVTFAYKGQTLRVLKGYSYDERTWKDKDYMYVQTINGHKGYIKANSVTDLKSKWKGWTTNEETDDGKEKSSV